MGLIGGSLGYGILRTIAPAPPARTVEPEQHGSLKLERFLGTNWLAALSGKTVIDFGCGDGRQAAAIAEAVPDCRVIGLDIQPRLIERARANAASLGLGERCEFTTETDERADVIISIDAFEHFSDPAAILVRMSELLAPDGEIRVSFGPTWLHPYGGHLFSVFPWSHLLFTERALIRWRSCFRSDGAQHFEEVEGGLNRIRIHRFERLVAASPLAIDWLETRPIRGLGWLRWRPFREFGSSVVCCRLVHRPRQRSKPDWEVLL